MSDSGPLDPYVARELRARVDDGDVAWLRLQHRAGRLTGLHELLAPEDWRDLGARLDAGDVAWARRVLGRVRAPVDADAAPDVAWTAPTTLPEARPPRERGRPGAWLVTGTAVIAVALAALGLAQCRSDDDTTVAGATTAAPATTSASTAAAAALAATTSAEASTAAPTTTATPTTSVAPTTTTIARPTTTGAAPSTAAPTTAAPTQDVVGAATTAGLTTFVRALTSADLNTTLGGAGPYTLLAPSEAAFSKLPAGTLDALLRDRTALVRALRYHVLPGRVAATQLVPGGVRTLEGSNVRVNVTGTQVIVNEAAVTQADVAATNGIVHVIDTVLLPPGFAVAGTPVTVAPRPVGDVVLIAKNDGRFGVLLGALDAAGLSATLQGSGPYTLFAPTDAAFRALPPELVTRLLADRATLAKVLTYHVLGGRLASASMKPGDLATVEGDPLTVGITEAGVTVDNAGVLSTDLAATNGVVHAIDKVLVPADVDLTKLGVPIVAPPPFTLTVYFNPDSATLRPDAAAAVADAATKIPAGARVSLVGVADQRGNPTSNRELSENRARSVQRALEAAGLNATFTITAKGAEPSSDLQLARRVELTAS